MSTHDNGAIETPEWSPEPHACPFERCFVCEPHEGAGTYPLPMPLDGRGEN